MIHKMSSQDFNKILDECRKQINETRISVNKIKEEIDIKTIVSQYEIEYTNILLKENSYASKDEEFITLSSSIGGLYEEYSSVAHAALKRDPINIFNLKATNSTNDFFRNEVDVTINGITNEYYKNILKSDNVKDKKIFFEERKDFTEVEKEEVEDFEKFVLNGNNIKLEVTLDESRAIGISKFNAIEIDPFLMGSFGTESIEIYEEDKDKPVKIIPAINRIGKTRIILDKKYLFKKVVFNIKPKYSSVKNDTKIIPFGFKHIFFLECDFRTDSKAIIRYKADRFIDHVNNSATLLTPFGKSDTTLTKMGIKIYLDYKNNILENEQQPSDMIKNPIARNVDTIYFEVPLIKKEEEEYIRNSITAVKFSIGTR